MPNCWRSTRTKWLLAGGLLAGLLIAVLAWQSDGILAAEEVYVGQVCQDANRPTLSDVDHSLFDGLLQEYVDDQGMVDYAGWKASGSALQALDEYLAILGCVDLSKSATKSGQLAFWINAYNAVTIRGILSEYPTSSIRNHAAKVIGYNIWTDLLLIVDGRSYSLDAIEHEILRQMGEPRIHFAIVCASVSCPPLRNRAYTGDQLDEQLAANARAFFAKPRNLRLDPRTRTVYISRILEWFGTDFAETTAAQLGVIRPYFPEPEGTAWVESSRVTVEYLEYDWSLNDQAALPE